MRKGKRGQAVRQHTMIITTQSGEEVIWEAKQGLPKVEARDGGYMVVLKPPVASKATVELTTVLPGSAAYGVQAGLITAITKSCASSNVVDYMAKR